MLGDPLLGFGGGTQSAPELFALLIVLTHQFDSFCEITLTIFMNMNHKSPVGNSKKPLPPNGCAFPFYHGEVQGRERL